MASVEYEIIDFHTHPFLTAESNICAHQERCKMDVDETLRVMDELNISRFCGSVIRVGMNGSDEELAQKMRLNNDEALALQARYQGRYVAGFHVNPRLVKQSCDEIERMAKKGIRLIGELVPYMDGWTDYSCKEFLQILEVAEAYRMIVSLHATGEDEMDKMVKEHQNVTFVAAHPGEYGALTRHCSRARLSDNYHIDLSGYGIFRYGALRRLIDCFGADRVLFGSDYPTCSVGMYVGGVLFDRTVSEVEKEKIFSLNAKRLLKL